MGGGGVKVEKSWGERGIGLGLDWIGAGAGAGDVADADADAGLRLLTALSLRLCPYSSKLTEYGIRRLYSTGTPARSLILVTPLSWVGMSGEVETQRVQKLHAAMPVSTAIHSSWPMPPDRIG